MSSTVEHAGYTSMDTSCSLCDFLNTFHLHVFYGIVLLVHLSGLDVGLVSIHSDVQGVLRFPDIL